MPDDVRELPLVNNRDIVDGIPVPREQRAFLNPFDQPICHPPRINGLRHARRKHGKSARENYSHEVTCVNETAGWLCALHGGHEKPRRPAAVGLT